MAPRFSHSKCSIRPLAAVASVQNGFTAIELVLVIVLVGILGVYAAPRVMNINEFQGRGFHDENLALLRYAQKTAIAQRRTVCADFGVTPVTLKLSIASAAGASACDTSLSGPNKNCVGGPTGPQACITAPTNVSYATPPAALKFNGLGQPSSAMLIQVAVSGVAISRAITIESVTGYVHE